jgi:hypothetical protein
MTEAPEGDGHAIFGGSCYGDSSSLDDAQSVPQWKLNNISSSSSDHAPSNEEISNGSGNGFENLITD